MRLSTLAGSPPTAFPRVVSIGLGALWVSLAVAKTTEPRAWTLHVESLFGLGAAGLLAWAVTIGEFMLGLLLMVAGPRRALLLGSLLISLGMGVAALLAPQSAVCGCFGGVLRETRANRILVSGVMAVIASLGLSATSQRK